MLFQILSCSIRMRKNSYGILFIRHVCKLQLFFVLFFGTNSLQRVRVSVYSFWGPTLVASYWVQLQSNFYQERKKAYSYLDPQLWNCSRYFLNWGNIWFCNYKNASTMWHTIILCSISWVLPCSREVRWFRHLWFSSSNSRTLSLKEVRKCTKKTLITQWLLDIMGHKCKVMCL